MKPNRFLWLFLFIFTGSAGIYLYSCQRDTEQPPTKPLSDTPVGERSCGAGYCLLSVRVDADADFEFCGDVANGTGGCSEGCNPSTDQYIDVQIPANTTYQLCVQQSGSVCIQNASASNAIGVTVQFGSSTPIVTTVPAGGKKCFSTNSTCSTTSNINC